MESIDTVLSKIMKGSGLNARMLQYRALRDWEKVVGSYIAKAVTPVAVQNGVLILQTKSSSWMQELTFQRKEILEKLNRFLGAPVIHDLRFTMTWRKKGETQEKSPSTGPKGTDFKKLSLTSQQQAEIDRISTEIHDPLIRQSFLRFMETSLKSDLWKTQNGWPACERCGRLRRPEQSHCPACSATVTPDDA